MANVTSLTEVELQKILQSPSNILYPEAIIEIRRRDRRKAFMWGTMPAWIALIISLVSLAISAGYISMLSP